MAPPRFRTAEIISRTARSAEVFDALKRDIMLGALAAGEALTELDLAARFACSQGPVREALLQLQEEGLVLRQGHRGTRVSDCTIDEAVEMFRMRQSIECRGVARALRRPSGTLAAELASLLALMEKAAADDDEYHLADLDRDFHLRLFRDAGLPAIEPILHRCLIHNHRFKISRFTGRRDLVATARRHLSILDAVKRGDEAAAVGALGHHIATIVDLGPEVFAGPSR